MLFIIEIVVFCLRNENKEIKKNYFLKGIKRKLNILIIFCGVDFNILNRI